MLFGVIFCKMSPGVGGGGGGTLIFSYIGADNFLGFKILKFFFSGFQKN